MGPGSRATGATPTPRRPGSATAGTGPGTSPTGTRTTSSTSAGGDYDWLRVDGENFAAAPVEEVLQRHPDVVLASVYAVPDTVVGDQVMAALLLGEGRELRPRGIRRVPGRRTGHGNQMGPPLRPDQRPVPGTATTKVLKRVLRAEGWRCQRPGVVAPGEGCAATGGCSRPTPMPWTRPSPNADRVGGGRWSVGCRSSTVVARRPSTVDRRPKTTTGDVGEDPGRRRLPVERGRGRQ